MSAGDWTVDAQLQQAALGVDLRAELQAIAQDVQAALAGLDDEHEAKVTTAIVQLHTRAAACLHLVVTW